MCQFDLSAGDFRSQDLSSFLQPFSRISRIAAGCLGFVCLEARATLVGPSSEFLVMNFLLKVLITNMTAPLTGDYHQSAHRFVFSNP